MFNRQQFHFCILPFIIVQLALINGAYSQPALIDVPAAFKAISTTPQVLHLKNGMVKPPHGGHLQGIQCLNDSVVVVTASSASYSYYLIAQLNQQTGKGQIKSLKKISDSPFRHAGGCQVNGNKMLVGIEDNRAKDKSQIILTTFNDSVNQTGSEIIARRKGSIKRSTAGAVGFTKDGSGRYMIAVGDWDSRNIDFYLSKSGSELLFDSLTTFSVPVGQMWPSYQSINLLTNSNGKIYLIGFALDGANNRADLFEVRFRKENVNLVLCTTRNFKCRGGAGFRYASGVYVTPKGQLTIYSCGRNVSLHLPINIFR